MRRWQKLTPKYVKMETISATITRADLRRKAPGYTVILEFDYGGIRKRYLPQEFKRDYFEPRPPDIIGSLMDVCNVRSWREIENARVRIRCDFENLLAIGHQIKDLWINFDEQDASLDHWYSRT